MAAVTDFLDGLLARRWGQITAVGSFLDPLADKVLINGMAVPLAMQGLVPPSLVALMLGRDVAIIAGVMCEKPITPPSLDLLLKPHKPSAPPSPHCMCCAVASRMPMWCPAPEHAG
eukprot:COSAG01_NODE_8664_length_2704_cov_3.383877_3_plen_116_part_00